jgi:hypothetical protein
VALVDQDQEQLRLLTIFHYLYAGMVAFFACFPIIHLVIGVLLLTNPGAFGKGNNAPPPIVGYLFAIMGGAFVLGGWAIATCSFLVGRSLARRTRYMFCIIVSALNCIFVPIGTALGIFTIMVLQRPAVKILFAGSPASPSASP